MGQTRLRTSDEDSQSYVGLVGVGMEVEVGMHKRHSQEGLVACREMHIDHNNDRILVIMIIILILT